MLLISLFFISAFFQFIQFTIILGSGYTNIPQLTFINLLFPSVPILPLLWFTYPRFHTCLCVFFLAHVMAMMIIWAGVTGVLHLAHLYSSHFLFPFPLTLTQTPWTIPLVDKIHPPVPFYVLSFSLFVLSFSQMRDIISI